MFAFRQKISASRASLRILSSIEKQNVLSNRSEYETKLIKQYREKIEMELTNVCDDILGVLDWNLVPFATSNESKVLSFFSSLSFQHLFTLIIFKLTI